MANQGDDRRGSNHQDNQPTTSAQWVSMAAALISAPVSSDLLRLPHFSHIPHHSLHPQLPSSSQQTNLAWQVPEQERLAPLSHQVPAPDSLDLLGIPHFSHLPYESLYAPPPSSSFDPFPQRNLWQVPQQERQAVLSHQHPINPYFLPSAHVSSSSLDPQLTSSSLGPQPMEHINRAAEQERWTFQQTEPAAEQQRGQSSGYSQQMQLQGAIQYQQTGFPQQQHVNDNAPCPLSAPTYRVEPIPGNIYDYSAHSGMYYFCQNCGRRISESADGIVCHHCGINFARFYHDQQMSLMHSTRSHSMSAPQGAFPNQQRDQSLYMSQRHRSVYSQNAASRYNRRLLDMALAQPMLSTGQEHMANPLVSVPTSQPPPSSSSAVPSSSTLTARYNRRDILRAKNIYNRPQRGAPY